MSVDVETRARLSEGTSMDAVYHLVLRALQSRNVSGGILLDVGCGTGQLWGVLRPHFHRYLGADVVRYDGFPSDGEFLKIDLDQGRVPLPDGHVDVVVSAETIEHLENPRAFVRELTRLCKPGGWMVITTPNQLSLLSLLSLIVHREFVWFRDNSYPAHLTALLEVDLRRITGENGWQDVAILYSECGRMPGTSRNYPRRMSRKIPRLLSDQIAVVGRKPIRESAAGAAT